MSNTPPEALVIVAVPEPVLSIVPALQTTVPSLVRTPPSAKYFEPAPLSTSVAPGATRNLPLSTPALHALALPVSDNCPVPASVPPLKLRFLRFQFAVPSSVPPLIASVPFAAEDELATLKLT